MNKTLISMITLATVATAGVGAAVAANASAFPAASASPSATSSVAGTEWAKQLAFTREEERMAKDLYAALAAAHDGARPMSMITNSENQHFTLVGQLLTQYGLPDPSAGRDPGSYAEPELQKLYDGWLARGKASVNAAYTVGAELEKRDIADLKSASVAGTPTDVQSVYDRLLVASERHLTAYENALAGKLPTNGGMGPQRGAGNGHARNWQARNGQGGQGACVNGSSSSTTNPASGTCCGPTSKTTGSPSMRQGPGQRPFGAQRQAWMHQT
jgi:hypothetical protein